MKLYSRPLSPYSAMVRGVAYLKDLPLKIIAPPDGVPIPEEFRSVTLLKRIPVLITGSGETVIESAVIAEYLEERFPEPPLLPSDPKDRARVRMFTRIADLDVLVPANRVLNLHYAPDGDERRRDEAVARLHRGLRATEERMAEGPYALGGELSLADAWLTPIRFVLGQLGHDIGHPQLLAEYPKLDAYRHIAVQQQALARVWNEMTDGLAVFLSQRELEQA